MALPRQSALLPTIKCSSCGRQVEISMMGDHLCGRGPAELSPPPEANDEFDNLFDSAPYSKHGRTPPPKVDTGAANKPFMSRGQLTPVSQPSESRSASPVPPGSRTRSPGRTRRPGRYGGVDEPDLASLGKQGAALLDRMNAIAPGPLDAGGRWAAPDELPGAAAAAAAMAPPRVPRKHGYGGFGPPSSAVAAADDDYDDDLPPATPGFISRSDTYPRPSPAAEAPRRLPSAPGTRAERLRTTGSLGDDHKRSIGPDVSRRPPPRTSLLAQHPLKGSQSVDLAAEFGVGNPYHTPSGSASSSGYSAASYASQASSRTTAPRPQTPPPRPADPYLDADPYAYGGGSLSPRRERHDPGDLPAARGRHGRHDDASPQARERSAPASRTGSRGDCKACRLPIRGKSIASADGRLTGKYHKACFVCATCAAPFASAEFYVLGDRPYCEQHYHKLNGSLCGGCGRGIEGQYLEDEARSKYHVGCFRCLDCARSLSDGYFEVDGKAYCERDAWRRTQQQPPLPPAPAPGPAEHAAGRRTGVGLDGRPGGRAAGAGAGAGVMLRPPVWSSGSRLGAAAGGASRPQMNKRMTRLGQM